MSQEVIGGLTGEIDSLVRQDANPDFRINAPYEARFISSAAVRAVADYITSVPYNENALVSMLLRHIRGKQQRHYTTNELLGLLGELFLQHALDVAVNEIPGVRHFPENLASEEVEIVKGPMGYDVNKILYDNIGNRDDLSLTQIDGLVMAQTDEGEWKPFVFESKVGVSNKGAKGSFNAAISPKGVKAHTGPFVDIFGSVAHAAIVCSDRIMPDISPQREFLENGGIILPFPFTRQQAETISGRVSHSFTVARRTDLAS